MKNMPVVIARYFMQFEKKDIPEALAVLIKSRDGDDYYLTDVLVEDKVITAELGEAVMEATKHLSYDEIFGWYTTLVS
ncbi:hypothetical protein [Enterococcus sp. DIV0800]|uniref:hypothetical protein n=1 Tax=unclassified Enterococcus TaxID=2608891 RepID=UPI003D300A46